MIVRLMGGLGNQMFQAAFGLSVGAARREPVSFSSPPYWRPYGLSAFLADIQFAPETPSIFHEPGFTFHPGVYALPHDMTYIGYWQTPKYFDEPRVRAAFRLRGEPCLESKAVAERILKAPHSVFVHIRRGDYTQGATRDYHGLLPPEYYAAAEARIRASYPDAEFFIFSDDPQWCRERLPHTFTVVSHNGDRPHEDIWLMSLCKHGIIANSSFSWWGAWLGDDRPERIVVAPQQWFQANLDTRDLIPSTWIRL